MRRVTRERPKIGRIAGPWQPVSPVETPKHLRGYRRSRRRA
jgi:hypothetical protein